MSQTREVFVSQSDFDDLVERVDGLDKKVDEGFRDMRRNQGRMQHDIMQLRREQSHHSQLISELKIDVSELKRGQEELKRGQEELKQEVTAGRQENAETRNMVKQILEMVSKP